MFKRANATTSVTMVTELLRPGYRTSLDTASAMAGPTGGRDRRSSAKGPIELLEVFGVRYGTVLLGVRAAVLHNELPEPDRTCIASSTEPVLPSVILLLYY